uniref:T-complex 11 n=1 Tax=Gorilla gorilla gorilla TaxID=9595 RepID=A0A2I2ZV16_GORGO
MTRGGGGGDTISKMPDVEESVPPKYPGDSEGRSCKPETSGPPQEDKTGSKDPPPCPRAEVFKEFLVLEKEVTQA